MGEGRVTVAALAAELGVSVATVTFDAMVAGVTPHRGPYTAAQAEAIRAARRDRLARISQLALAAQLGVTPATVAKRAGWLGFGGGTGYTPEQAEAIRRSFAATPPRASRGDQG
jgi:DNA-binding MurR/RpiR family transcriptional regulator